MYFLGIDTSCYTTSVAVADAQGNILLDRRSPLCVPEQARGDVYKRQGEGCFGQKCTVIDEREELWGEAFSLGLRTDILRCNKKSGISMALRTLSPECIATDELGDPADFSAVFQAATAGVRILATAHGNSLSDLRCKPLFDEMYRHKVIDRFVVLSDSRGRGTVEQILDANGLPLIHQPLRLQSVEEGKQHVV